MLHRSRRSPSSNRYRSQKLALAALGSLLLFVTPAACAASEFPATINATDLSRPQSAEVQSLLNAEVVYLGERHDSVADHAAQLELIEWMYRQNPDLAIALEMFQRPFQPVIDRYLAGEISEAELVVQTEYEQRWGFSWEYYAPILRFAQANQIPVLALNAPSEVVRQVSRGGLASLKDDDFRYIPSLQDIDTQNEDYRAFVREAFGSHGSHGNFNFENFFAAQVVWDETMAEAIAQFKQVSPNTTVVVLAGQGHVIYGYGIPDRVARRLGEDLEQTTVLLNFPREQVSVGDGAIADLLWYSQ